MIVSAEFLEVMLAKATALLVIGGIAVSAARGAASATRHAILALTLATILALPIGMIALPTWNVRMLPQRAEKNVIANTVTPNAGAASAPEVRALASEPVAGTSQTSFVSDGGQALWVPVLWIAGALAVLLWMIVGRLSLHRVARRATALGDGKWQTILAEEKARAGVEDSISLLSSPAASTPLTWGARSRVILLPIEADEWSDEHRAVVLRHEIAHIARGDSLTQLLAGVTCALYWFHPLVWVAARKLRAEQERACDDRVLSSGTPRTEYAAHLLEVARSARALGGHGMVSLAMARPSQLEGRLMAVLNHTPSRARVSPVARVAGVAATVAVFLALSAFRPMPRAVIRSVVTPTIIASQVPAPPSPIAMETGVVRTWTKPATTSAFDSTISKTVEVPSDGTLVLDLKTGAGLTITGWDEPRVRVTGTLGGQNWRETEVVLERLGADARLSTRFTGNSSNQSTRHQFDIMVPRRFNVRLSSAGGGVTISGVDGDFSGNTGGGPLMLERLSGHADLHTGGGNIRVKSSRLSGSVTTGGGTAAIQDNTGNLTAHSGSGPVVYLDSDGSGYGSGRSSSSRSSSGRSSSTRSDDGDEDVRIGGNTSTVTINDATGEIRDTRTGRILFRKSGGGVNLAEAMQGADIRTGGGGITIGRTGGTVEVSSGGGNISIGRSSGDVHVTTGGGDIQLGPVAGSADAQTGKGDVTIRLDGADNHKVGVSSGTGKVILIVPSNLSAILDLETAYTNNYGRRTRIESDWPLSITETDYWDASNGTPRKYVRARQAVGHGGPLIRVRTVNGDVIVQRR